MGRARRSRAGRRRTDMRAMIAALLLSMAVLMGPAFAAEAPAVTASGIPLDAPWKVRIYELAHSKFRHPAWGWQHSERDYLMAVRLAKGDGLHVDTDVLFAAAFLHDMAAFMPCGGQKMEHGECAARQAGTMLRRTGFPMRKLAAVQAAERGHMFYSNPGTDPTPSFCMTPTRSISWATSGRRASWRSRAEGTELCAGGEDAAEVPRGHSAPADHQDSPADRRRARGRAADIPRPPAVGIGPRQRDVGGAGAAYAGGEG